MTKTFRAWLALPILATTALGCSSEDSPTGSPVNASDAGSDISDSSLPDASDGSDATQDHTLDQAAPPDVFEDVGSDGDAPDTLPTWAGHPWYGCTPDDEPSAATIVTAFELEDQYFNPEDRRAIDAQVSFPEAGSWQRIDMIVDLTCPADGNCDNWDRFANVMLVEDPGGTNEEVLELERYMTPFNVGMCLRTDVTRFAPRLTGTKTIRSFIDTWVGPDEPVHGHGWRTTVKFVFHPGTPDPNEVPSTLVALWPFDSVEVGNPDAPFDEAMGTKTVTIPQGTTRAELRVVATGHGQGNRLNCAEFCALAHELTVNGVAFSFDPWRTDCAKNPIGPLQAGTWKYNRAGWCPGAYAIPQVLDVTGALQPGGDAVITYDSYSTILGAYENTCRPGAGDANNLCSSCTFDNSPGNCDYNGASHTQPHHRIAVQLLLYP